MTEAVLEQPAVALVENHRSPAFAALMAKIMMPEQYDGILQAAVMNVNTQCKGRTVHIDK